MSSSSPATPWSPTALHTAVDRVQRYVQAARREEQSLRALALAVREVMPADMQARLAAAGGQAASAAPSAPRR